MKQQMTARGISKQDIGLDPALQYLKLQIDKHDDDYTSSLNEVAKSGSFLMIS